MEEKLGLLLTYLMCYVLSIVTYPLILIILITMYIYRQIVVIIVKIKTKVPSSDITWFYSGDTAFTVGEVHQNTICCLAILNTNGDNIEDLVKQAKQRFQDNILNKSKQFPKMNSCIYKCMGYPYLVKKKINIDDIISLVEVDDVKDKNKTLNDVLSCYYRSPLPLDNRFLWQIIFLKTSDDWRRKQKLTKNQCPMIIKIHHGVGDGLSLLNILSYSISDNPIDFNKMINKTFQHTLKKKNSFIQFLLNINLLLLSPGVMLFKLLTYNRNVWKNSEITETKHIAYNAEPVVGMVNKVKSIKRRLGDTAFTEIMLTGISGSLQEYFKKTQETPESVNLALLFIPFLNSVNMEDGTPELKNQFSYFPINIPLRMNTNSTIDRLKAVKIGTRSKLNVPLIWAQNIVFSKVLGLLPSKLVKVMLGIHDLPICFSNLPGIPKISLFNGNDLDHLYVFPPSIETLGLVISLTSYDNQFHLTLCSATGIIKSKDEAQKLVDDIIKQIQLLEDESIAKLA